MTDREIPQALARRMAKLIEEEAAARQNFLTHQEWFERKDAILRELQPPDPVAEAVNWIEGWLNLGYCPTPQRRWSTIKAALADRPAVSPSPAQPSEAWIRADERERVEREIADYCQERTTISMHALNVIRSGAYHGKSTEPGKS